MAPKHPVRRRAAEPETPTETAEVPADVPSAPAPVVEAPAEAPSAQARRGLEVRTILNAPAPTAQERAIADAPSALEALAAGGDIDMAALMSEGSALSSLPDPGTRVKGTVVRVSHDSVYIDLGARSAGWIGRRDAPDVQVGDEVEAFVLQSDDLGVQLSLRLTGDAAAMHLEEAFEGEIPVEGVVENHNAGGYTVKVGPVRAFCPISQMSRLPLADPASVVGQTLSFKVREIGDKVVLSRRDLQEAEIEATREARLASLEEGQTLHATITSVQPWGMFLDADGVDLRMAKHEATWDEVDDLSKLFERGQEVPVRVTRIDSEKGRISVSGRDPSLDPWSTITTRFTSGSVTSGTVVSHTDFGVFVQVAPGVQGLVHRSRMSSKSPAVGTAIDVRILSIDPERRRLELAPSDFDPALQAQNTVGVEVSGEVIEVGDGGIAVRLADGRRAWLAAREVDLDAGTVMAQRFRVGHTVTARIASEDERRGRITLTQRSQDDDSDWRAAMKQAGGGQAAGMGTLGDLLGGWKKS